MNESDSNLIALIELLQEIDGSPSRQEENAYIIYNENGDKIHL